MKGTECCWYEPSEYDVVKKLQSDLDALRQHLLQGSNPDRLETFLLFHSLPRLSQWASSSDTPAYSGRYRLGLHAYAMRERVASQGSDACCEALSTPARREMDICADSYRVFMHFSEEVAWLLERLDASSERSESGILVKDFPGAERSVRLLSFLRSLIESRLMADVLRWYSAKSGDIFSSHCRSPDTGAYLWEADRKLRRAWMFILQRTPCVSGASPEGLQNYYARHHHPDAEHYIKRYAQAFLPDWCDCLHGFLVPASSCMALIHEVLHDILEVQRRSQAVRVGLPRGLYFETKQIVKEFAHRCPRGRITLVWFNNLSHLREPIDVLFVEPLPNSPEGRPQDVLRFLEKPKPRKLRWLIIDKTLHPFVLDDIKCWPSNISVAIVESLTKYAQMGANVATAGMATLLQCGHGRPKMPVLAVAERIAKRLARLGQHSDHRLSLCMAGDRRLLRNRLAIMQRNASILRSLLTKEGYKPLLHELHGTCSTMIYLRLSVPKKYEHDPAGFTRELLGSLVTETETGAAWIRMGASFGFNRTSLEVIARPAKAFLRISAGMETEEVLRFLWDEIQLYVRLELYAQWSV